MVFGMSGFERYIDDLVNNREPEEFGSFPKNESSWEELYNFGEKRIVEIVALKRRLSTLQKRVELLEGIIFRNCDTMDMTHDDEIVAQEIYQRMNGE